MIGQILRERYDVQRRLGKQTGRQTLLARDRTTQELVVIKLLYLGSDFEWKDLKLFEREAETLKALFHPAIPRYLDWLEIDEPDNKGFALVQSYVEGKTLEEHLLAGRTFSEAEVKELAKSLLEILNYLHGRQPPVIHRDIKPSNILLTNRSGNSVGKVYLVDFGSVQNVAAREGGTITVVGTYGYMPPEQFGGRTTPASDLYSLGATLIYLVTGLHPTELPQKDFRIEFQQVAKLNPDFADWLEWMTEPSLDRRLGSAEEALSALEKPRIRRKGYAIASKPLYSEVVLRKSADFLEIILPPNGLGFGLIALLSAVAPVLLLWFPALGIYSEGIGGLIFGVSVLVLLVRMIVFALFRRIGIRIDGEKISVTNEVFGLRWNYSRPARRQDISELEIIQYVFGVNSKREEDRSKPRLIIRVGKEKYYEVDRNERLTEPEINWLACELSDWLGLPIIRK